MGEIGIPCTPSIFKFERKQRPRPLASKSVRKQRAMIDYPSMALTRSCLLHGLVESSDSFHAFLTRRRHFGLTVFPTFSGQLNSMENAKLSKSLHKNVAVLKDLQLPSDLSPMSILFFLLCEFGGKFECTPLLSWLDPFLSSLHVKNPFRDSIEVTWAQ